MLEGHARISRVRGIRQVLNRHPDPKLNRADRDYLADENWRRNLGLLRKFDMSFDVQVYYQQMPEIASLARRYPDIQFIIDHAGMPAERGAPAIDGWLTMTGCGTPTPRSSPGSRRQISTAFSTRQQNESTGSSARHGRLRCTWIERESPLAGVATKCSPARNVRY